MLNKKGFTLIELMVVVFIIAILVAAAVPSYLDNLRRTRYQEALVALQKVAQANKTFAALYNRPVVGEITQADTNNKGDCKPDGDNSTAVLYRCGYLIKDEWDALAFRIFSCNPGDGSGGGCCRQGAYAAMQHRNIVSNYCGLINAKMEICEPNGGPNGEAVSGGNCL